MKKINCLLASGIGLMLSFSSWADFSGSYDCEWTDKGEQKTAQVVTKKKGETYEFTMTKPNKDSFEDVLIKTNNPNVFLNGWKAEKHVGIATWTFSDDSLKIESKHRSIDVDGEKDIIKTCKLHK